MIRVADYLFQRLASVGLRHIFLVTGGAAMHLNDALAKETRIQPVCTHHEQAAAMAAEGYSRVTGGLGVINVTAGPGAINALNGVFGAWTDSIPMLILSGQAKRQTSLRCMKLTQLRQLGDQEVDIIRMVQGITKYAGMLTEPGSVRYVLEKALYLATAGRPGPCWLDIPIDVQGSMVDADNLRPYDPSEDAMSVDPLLLGQRCRQILARLRESQRPVILVGSGIRLAHAQEVFERVIRLLGVPVALAWTALDLLASDDPLYCGRPGTVGDRPGNFTVQNADLLLVIGCRLSIRQVSYNWQSFAPHAYKIVVDIDPQELEKPMVRPDLAIASDARQFLEVMEKELAAGRYEAVAAHGQWLGWCKERLARYPVLLPRHRAKAALLNPYDFFDQLFGRLNADEVVVCGNGAASVMAFQVATIKKGMRVFANAGSASMGYDLPAAIGAAVARAGKRVICIAGDGSLQFNLQELQTVVHYKLPVKLFVINNGGYLSIHTTQQTFFGRFIGESPATGVSFPDLMKIAAAYGLTALRITKGDCGALIDQALASEEAVLCEVVVDPTQQFEPKLSSRQLSDGTIVTAALEDMAPFLDRDELQSNILYGKPHDTHRK